MPQGGGRDVTLSDYVTPAANPYGEHGNVMPAGNILYCILRGLDIPMTSSEGFKTGAIKQLANLSISAGTLVF